MAVSTRQALLQALSSAGGSYVSGQQLAETLGVSRAAVHKAGWRRPVLHRSHRGLPCTHLFI